ncbi:amidohydrolase family protein [Mesorhizobium calcicola]|uniref:Amidohydrolase family protein n=1 Tax=Mesorhizobium calcicola TaxID=1300310 RepID=A0ABW4WEM5_9HYPH
MSHWNPHFQLHQHTVAAAPIAATNGAPGLSRLRATNPAGVAEPKPGKGQRILIRGGTVVTMADDHRDFAPGDILIDGDRIVDIDHKIDATDAFVIDATGMIVVPGMVDTHRHTWQSTVHTLGPDWLLSDYFGFMRGVIGRVYRPEDLYIATLLGALEGIDSGTTTLVDWAHLMNTPAHADASVLALKDSGIRAVFGYGNSNAGYEFPNTHRLDTIDARRVRDQYFSGTGGLVTMAIAARGPDYSSREVWMDDFKAARELGLPITVHVGSNGSYSYSVGQLHEAGLLGPDITHVHCNSLKSDEYKMIADTGGTVSISVESEMHLGCGANPLSRLLANGIRPSISTDVPSVNSCDILGALRITLGTHRGQISQQMLDHSGEKTESRLTTRDILEFATLRGAAAAGLSGKTGMLAAGMQADIVLLSYKRVGLFPLHNPTALVVMNATPADVDTVVIAGKIMKRHGVLDVDLAAITRAAEASADYLYSQSKMKPRPTCYRLGA